MKKSIIMAATALFISVSIAAQTNEPVQNRTRLQSQEQAQENAAAREGKEKKVKTRKANHGQTVSETARNTESGEGKGEIVSAQAKNQGAVKNAQFKNQTAAKNQGAARPANAMHQNKGAAAKGSAAGRK